MQERNGLVTEVISEDGHAPNRKYFRFMEDPERTWKPYCNEPMYDDHPEMGTFQSTLYVPHPEEGDYLIQESDGTISIQRPYDADAFDEVFFDAMPSLETLLSQGLLIEASEDIRTIDYQLQKQLDKLHEEYMDIQESMDSASDFIYERRFGFPTKLARESKQLCKTLKPKLEKLERRIFSVREDLYERVCKPLRRSKYLSHHPQRLDQKIKTAQAKLQDQEANTREVHTMNPQR